MMTAAFQPFSDITNLARGTKPFKMSDADLMTPQVRRGNQIEEFSNEISPEVWSPSEIEPSRTLIRVYQHNPYGWRALPADEIEADSLMRQYAASRAAARMASVPLLHTSLLQQQAALALQALLRMQPCTKAPFTPAHQAEQRVEPQEKKEARPKEVPDTTPPAPEGEITCQVLVQFKCHQGEYSSTVPLTKGQYIVVQGDRGIDIGLVNRVNTDQNKQFIERTGPIAAVLRAATTQEVEYWATDLKKSEEAAIEFCRQRIVRNNLTMEVRNAEYQYDKNKLTFYYEARTRVDFVVLLKELYRQFGCRIWMEKVRQHE